MNRKSTPNQTYLNKNLIPMCQKLFKERGITGIKFAKYLEYTYAIIRHNTEAELDDLYAVISENVGDLREYIVKNYPTSRSLLERKSAISCSEDEIPYVQALYISKGLNPHNESDNAKWGRILTEIAKYCKRDGISVDQASRLYADMTPEELQTIVELANRNSAPAEPAQRNDWVKGDVNKTRAALKLPKSEYGKWNAAILKVVWHFHKLGGGLDKFLEELPADCNSPEGLKGLIS